MKRSLDISDFTDEPPRKRYKVLHIRRPGYTARKYATRSTAVAANVIARFWREYRKFIPSDNVTETGTRGVIRKGGKDVICPITQDTIPTGQVFKFVSVDTGHVHAYTVEDLVNYFRSSGNFRCPLTREEFTRCTVRRLSQKAVSAGISAFSLPGIYEMRHSILQRTIERDNRILAIENSCGIAMTECLDMCSNLNVSTVAATNQLMNYLLPEWKQLVNDYLRFYPEDCKTMLSSDKDKMLRLQRSDLRDPHNLISMVKEAIDTKLSYLDRGPPDIVEAHPRTFQPRRLFTPFITPRRPRTPEHEEVVNTVVEDILNGTPGEPMTSPVPFPEVDNISTVLEDLNRRLMESLSQDNGSRRIRYFFPAPDPDY